MHAFGEINRNQLRGKSPSYIFRLCADEPSAQVLYHSMPDRRCSLTPSMALLYGDGCKGTHVCHIAERDSLKGMDVTFPSRNDRKDGRDEKARCRPQMNGFLERAYQCIEVARGLSLWHPRTFD